MDSYKKLTKNKFWFKIKVPVTYAKAPSGPQAQGHQDQAILAILRQNLKLLKRRPHMFSDAPQKKTTLPEGAAENFQKHSFL